MLSATHNFIIAIIATGTTRDTRDTRRHHISCDDFHDYQERHSTSQDVTKHQFCSTAIIPSTNSLWSWVRPERGTNA
jgi:hypothetical protein